MVGLGCCAWECPVTSHGMTARMFWKSVLLVPVIPVILGVLAGYVPLHAGVGGPAPKLTVRTERTLAPGVTYREYRTNGRRPSNVHVVAVNRTVAGNAIRVVKALNHALSREPLVPMSDRYEVVNGDAVMAMVNANFWAAVRNNPIGPCVVDGEVIEMTPHKQWSSAFFDARNRLFIDTFRLQGTVTIGSVHLPITSTNRRSDSTGVVVYNQYGGKTVPFITPEQLEWLWQQSASERSGVDRSMGDDSTEQAVTEADLRAEMARAHLEQNREHPMVKIQVRYLRFPSVNRTTPCRVLAVDTGIVSTPLRGSVISLPRSALAGPLPRLGDTVLLEFKTNLHEGMHFMNAVSGTPRLVRNGVAGHEAAIEGVTGKRFIRQHLARTALGSDETGDVLFLVAVEPSRKDRSAYGATLADLASIMEALGAHQAMNLDGGGSTGMVIENRHAFFDEPVATRPVSVGLAVVRLQHVLRAYQYSK